MAYQDIHHHAGARNRLLHPSRLAWAFVLGVALAAGLVALSRGTEPVSGAPDWHGNVAVSGSLR